MKKLIRDFITFLLDFWYVPLEDYLYVQEQRWAAERRIEQLVKEQLELMDSIYVRKYGSMAELGPEDEVSLVEFPHFDRDEIEYRWSFRIARRRFVMSFDPKEEIYNVQRHVLERVAFEFMQNLAKKLQWDI